MPYSSGEYRTSDLTYSYGRYEIQMKPAAGSGLMNGFFTYTGASDGQPHDEVDVEFAGQDLTTLRTNYWINDVSHEQLIPLGFNAGDAFHTYAFEWLPNRVRWYVDGVLVREVLGATPSRPQRAMINLWAGDSSAQSWLGTFNYSNPVSAQFKNFTFTPISVGQGNFLVDEQGELLIDESGNVLLEDGNYAPAPTDIRTSITLNSGIILYLRQERNYFGYVLQANYTNGATNAEGAGEVLLRSNDGNNGLTKNALGNFYKFYSDDRGHSGGWTGISEAEYLALGGN